MVSRLRIGAAAALIGLLAFLSGALLLNSGAFELDASLMSTAIRAQNAVQNTNSVASPSETTAENAPSPKAATGVLDARPAVRSAGPAVVTIINRMDAQGGAPNRTLVPTASGSGVIIDRDGNIITNAHVVDDVSSLEVIFSDGRKAPGRLIGADRFSDVAVVKVDVEVPAVAELGDSDLLEPGQPVVAIGSALGDFRNTVTVGVVSALNRDIENAGSSALQNLIQTDAEINHGNSGGPLLQLDGKVIGINVAVVRGNGIGDLAEGLGFAIPSNTARRVAAQLISNGEVERPYLGISFQVITPQVAAYLNLGREQGVWVREVVDGSPAAAAGIQAESVITKFDGVELTEDNSLLELLMKHKAGDTVRLTVISPGQQSEREVSVTLGVRPNNE